jgi:ribonuclease HI
VIRQTVGDIQSLYDQFKIGNLILMCDGSTKNGYGAAAWNIASMQTYPEVYARGSARSSGLSEEQSSHRVECICIMRGLQHLHTLLDSMATKVRYYYYCMR